MGNISKITIFSFLLLLAVFSLSCNRENDVIPDVMVDFTIDLTNPAFNSITSFGGAVVISNSSPVAGTWRGGYDSNGIIVFAGVDEYYAYDRTCPHDYTENATSVKVNLDPSSSLFAICPVCESKYALSAYGTPASGKSRYPLKNYRTSYDGRFVRVWNY